MFHPALIAFVRKCFDVLARAVVAMLTICGLILVGVAGNWFFRFAMEAYGASYWAWQVLSMMNVVYCAVLVLLVVVLSVYDMRRAWG